MQSSQRFAYAISEYPAVSNPFIVGEVRHLRALEFDIHVASINSPSRHTTEMTVDEKEEASTTFYVKRAGVIGALRAHLAVFVTEPLGYLRGLFFALKLGKSDLGRIVYSVAYFSEALMVGRWMRSLGLAHLHIHFANPAATVGLIVGKTFDVGLSMTVHGPDEFYDVSQQLLREKIAGASFVCCIGQFTRSQLMNLSRPDQWSKFELAPCGVDSSLFKPQLQPQNSDPFEILCVARLVSAKGHHVLLKAIKHLTHTGHRVRLRLAGDGPERSRLEREVERLGLGEDVVFEGAVNQDHVRKLYSSANAFVLASFAEGVPVALMEAMAMEVPCISTFVGGIPELIRHNIDGILVAPSDDRGLANALEQMIDDPELRRRFATAGRRRIIEEYDLDRNVARLAQIFNERLPLPEGRRQDNYAAAADGGKSASAHANEAIS